MVGLVTSKISVFRGLHHWFAAMALPCPDGMGWPGISCLASYIVFPSAVLGITLGFLVVCEVCCIFR